jgi:hypothetical protein
VKHRAHRLGVARELPAVFRNRAIERRMAWQRISFEIDNAPGIVRTIEQIDRP